MAYTLITGASSGIGYEFAKIFARQGHDLVLVARSKDKMELLKSEILKDFKVKIEILNLDLSKQNSAEELFAMTQKNNFDVDILVNNAGFGDHGVFQDAEMTKIEDMITVNITTLTKLSKLFLRPMLDRKIGKILNVASTASFQPGPLMTVYYATKAYVLFFSEGLTEELKNSGVTVTALCPGPTESGFQVVANLNNNALVETMALPTSKDVAEYGYKVLMKGCAVAIHGLLNKIVANGVRFTPRSVTRKLVMKLQEKRKN